MSDRVIPKQECLHQLACHFSVFYLISQPAEVHDEFKRRNTHWRTDYGVSLSYTCM